MAIFADFALADGKATPVVHTFSARTIKEGTAKWQDISGGTPVGYPTIMLSNREPSPGLPSYKNTITIKVPVLEVASGSTVGGYEPAPSKAYEVLFKLEMVCPERSSVDVRKDARAYLYNLLNNATFKDVIENLSMVA